MNGLPRGPFHVFYSYSHADRRLLARLRTHLALLRRHGLITEWYDREIEAGAEWRAEIERELDRADVILLLVSADFLASDFAYEEEMLRAVERADQGEAMVIAVMLRPVDGWERTPFSKFQVVPRDARPITRWSNADAAYTDVAASIRMALESRIRSGTPQMVADEEVAAPKSDDIPANTDAADRAQEIATALKELLDRSDAWAYVIVTGDPEANYYTQCFTEKRSFWCEAVSNDFVKSAHKLTNEQLTMLGRFGWNPPESESRPNWWCVRGDLNDVCALFVRTLNEIYGVSPEAPFQIQRSWT